MRATARAIVKHGVSGLTVRDIGDELDRSRSLINYHYNSKDELLERFIEYTVERYTGDATYDPDVPPGVQLDRFVRRSLFGPDYAEERWTLVAAQYALRPEAMVNERMQRALTAGFAEIHRTLADVVAAGIEQGAIDANDPELVADVILGIVDAARGGKVILGDDEAPERLYRALTEFVYPALGVDPSA